MLPREFVDTKILVYTVTTDPKSVRAAAILNRRCIISVQALNEFVNVGRRRLGMSWDQIDAALADFRFLCNPTLVEIDDGIHEDAVRIMKRFGFRIFDALMVAAALKSGCSIFWSQDLQSGMLIDDRLQICNPFLAQL